MLCIYVEYCVTSRAGKCLETCNTDKPRFDDFVAVRVCTRPCSWLYRLYFVSSVSQRNSPTEARYRDRNFPNEETPPTLVSPRGTAQNFPLAGRNSASNLDHLLHWTTSLEILSGARTFDFFSNGNWYVLFLIHFTTRFFPYSKSLTFLYPCKVIINYYVNVDCVLQKH